MQEVVEMALAHTVKNKAEAAYRRGDLLHQAGGADGKVGHVLREASRESHASQVEQIVSWGRSGIESWRRNSPMADVAIRTAEKWTFEDDMAIHESVAERRAEGLKATVQPPER